MFYSLAAAFFVAGLACRLAAIQHLSVEGKKSFWSLSALFLPDLGGSGRYTRRGRNYQLWAMALLALALACLMAAFINDLQV
jgi:hypothetical protein